MIAAMPGAAAVSPPRLNRCGPASARWQRPGRPCRSSRVGVAFALSMEYEVFLVSRVQEAYDHGDMHASRRSLGSGAVPGRW